MLLKLIEYGKTNRYLALKIKILGKHISKLRDNRHVFIFLNDIVWLLQNG